MFEKGKYNRTGLTYADAVRKSPKHQDWQAKFESITPKIKVKMNVKQSSMIQSEGREETKATHDSSSTPRHSLIPGTSKDEKTSMNLEEETLGGGTSTKYSRNFDHSNITGSSLTK